MYNKNHNPKRSKIKPIQRTNEEKQEYEKNKAIENKKYNAEIKSNYEQRQEQEQEQEQAQAQRNYNRQKQQEPQEPKSEQEPQQVSTLEPAPSQAPVLNLPPSKQNEFEEEAMKLEHLKQQQYEENHKKQWEALHDKYNKIEAKTRAAQRKRELITSKPNTNKYDKNILTHLPPKQQPDPYSEVYN